MVKKKLNQQKNGVSELTNLSTIRTDYREDIKTHIEVVTRTTYVHGATVFTNETVTK